MVNRSASSTLGVAQRPVRYSAYGGMPSRPSVPRTVVYRLRCPRRQPRSPRGSDFVGTPSSDPGKEWWTVRLICLSSDGLSGGRDAEGLIIPGAGRVRSAGMVPPGCTDSAMYANVNHRPSAPRGGEIDGGGITRSQLPHSIARENPGRCMFRSHIVSI